MTGTEVAQAAKRYVNTYKYVYGAKGELCSSAHIEELIAQSPTYFSDEQKKTAARAKAGYYCADCSGYVCICPGTSQYGSYALYDIAAAKYPLTRSEGNVLPQPSDFQHKFLHVPASTQPLPLEYKFHWQAHFLHFLSVDI